MMLSFEQLKALDTNTLRQLNTNIVAIINARVKAERGAKMDVAQQKFNIGQMVKVVRPTGHVVGMMRIVRFNDKTVTGYEVNADGIKIGEGWRAPPSMLRAI